MVMGFMFKVGARVVKSKGYPFPGIVVAVFDTLSGQERVVVEYKPDVAHPGGLLHYLLARPIGIRSRGVAVMPVYVDNARIPFVRKDLGLFQPTYRLNHLWADSLEELFAMADRIGVKRKWLQRPRGTLGPDGKPLQGMDASWVHFDITASKRALAVKYGAIETDMFGPAEHCARLEGNEDKLKQIAIARARRAEPQGKLALE
jgi:hypothetical protein